MLNVIFWSVMVVVIACGVPEFKAWLAVRKLRKEIKEYESAEERDVPHL